MMLQGQVAGYTTLHCWQRSSYQVPGSLHGLPRVSSSWDDRHAPDSASLLTPTCCILPTTTYYPVPHGHGDLYPPEVFGPESGGQPDSREALLSYSFLH